VSVQIAPELVEACRRGDAGAFEELVRTTHRTIYGVVLRITGNPEDAADVTQEVYVRVWKSLRGFRGEANLATWMHRVATNAALTHLRRRGRMAEPVEEESMVERIATVGSEDARIDADEIEASLARLPDGYRVVVVLKDVYGMSCDEIGRRLGLTEGAVKVRLFRARRKLAEDLTRGGVVVPMRRKKVNP
jgi:RNA polymerase sigma-70 factor, ECF subfamily